MSVSSYYRLEASSSIKCSRGASPVAVLDKPARHRTASSAAGLTRDRVAVPIRDGQWIAMSLRDLQGRNRHVAPLWLLATSRATGPVRPRPGRDVAGGQLGIGQTR